MKKKENRKETDLSISKKKETYSNLDFYIVLMETEGSSNIGSIARSMKNFGFKNLVLFNPKCEIDSDARKYSMHAREDILEKAEIIKLPENVDLDHYNKTLKEFMGRFDYRIGTSAKRGYFRNIKRINFFVDEMDFSQIPNNDTVKIALLFGREPSGLTNDEIELCDFILTIPTSDDYKALNLAHAVTIVLFTIFKKTNKIKRGNILSSKPEQREILYERIQNTLKLLEFNEDVDKKIVRTFKNILGRSFSSMKEVNILISLFEQIKQANGRKIK